MSLLPATKIKRKRTMMSPYIRTHLKVIPILHRIAGVDAAEAIGAETEVEAEATLETEIQETSKGVDFSFNSTNRHKKN